MRGTTRGLQCASNHQERAVSTTPTRFGQPDALDNRGGHVACADRGERGSRNCTSTAKEGKALLCRERGQHRGNESASEQTEDGEEKATKVPPAQQMQPPVPGQPVLQRLIRRKSGAVEPETARPMAIWSRRRAPSAAVPVAGKTAAVQRPPTATRRNVSTGNTRQALSMGAQLPDKCT